MTNHKKPTIVIIGGGAGGLELATKLGHQLGKRHYADIVLVDKNLTHLWKPLLHEIAVGSLDSHADELNYISHAYHHYFHFQLGQLDGLDRENKKVLLTISDNENIELAYDYLVIAIGSVANNFGINGADEYCHYLDNRQQADAFQQMFIRRLLKVQNNVNTEQRALLDTVIIGGGATGVELAAELHHAISQAAHYGLRRLNSIPTVNITIIEAAPRVLAQLPERISKATHKLLSQSHINVLCRQRVVNISSDGVTTADGNVIPASIIVWAAGIKAPKVLTQLHELKTNRANQLLVKPTLQTLTDDTIFALGDCAACQLPNSEQLIPARAQTAHQQANLLAKSLRRIIKQKTPLVYHYRDYGSLVSLSDKGSIGQLMGSLFKVGIEGKLAHLVYLSLYKMHQVNCHGWWRVVLMSLAKWLTRRVKPRLKLH